MCSSGFYGMRTDVKVHGTAWGQYFQGPDVDNVEAKPLKEWNEASFSVVGVMKALPDQAPYGHLWDTTTFGTMLAHFTQPENRTAETAHLYRGAIAGMEVKNICISDLMGSGVCISSSSGQKVFGALKSVISQGNKVCISFENIKSLSPAFLESAIGQLYNGEVQRNIIAESLLFENVSPGRKLIIDEVIREAKEYYSDPEGYVKKMKELFADD